MAAGAASTKTLGGYLPTLDAAPQNTYLAAIPGTNATWAKFVAGTTTSDSAFADAGKMPILVDGTTYWIPVFTTAES